MSAERSWHESFMIRMWAEPNGAERILRGAIQNVQTGRTTYFDSTKLATELIQRSASRIETVRERAGAA
jgi:hypothetical protein